MDLIIKRFRFTDPQAHEKKIKHLLTFMQPQQYLAT
jgi:hypothetical protein